MAQSICADKMSSLWLVHSLFERVIYVAVAALCHELTRRHLPEPGAREERTIEVASSIQSRTGVFANHMNSLCFHLKVADPKAHHR